MSLWEFQAAADGWLKANGVGAPDGPTPQEHDELIAKYAHLDT